MAAAGSNKSADVKSLVAKLRSGDTRALARVLSHIEDGGAELGEIVELLFPHTGNAFVIGVTGPPGAGKSTLVDQLVMAIGLEGKKVGVLAVDPSSPFSGGALLGDRIRMGQATERHGVFVRSMATRGALGGVAPRTAEAIFALDAAGYEFIIVETVGVGQSEVEIVRTADTVIVVLVPGMGDAVQVLKAGILEIADIFAVNKSDYSGVDRLEKDLKTMLALSVQADWVPPILRTVASDGKGISELLTEILRHRAWSKHSGQGEKRRAEFLKQSFERQVREEAARFVLEKAHISGQLASSQKALSARSHDPRTLAETLVKKVFSGEK